MCLLKIKKEGNVVTVKESNDKSWISAPFAVSHKVKSLPIYIINSGKYLQASQDINFQRNMLKCKPKALFEHRRGLKVIWTKIDLQGDQKTIVIKDIVAGQTASDILKYYQKSNV